MTDLRDSVRMLERADGRNKKTEKETSIFEDCFKKIFRDVLNYGGQICFYWLKYSLPSTDQLHHTRFVTSNSVALVRK
jgi:hypothetical protein